MQAHQRQSPTLDQLYEETKLLVEDDLNILTIHPVQSRSMKLILVQVKVNNHHLEMELDTGASVSLINEIMYHKFWYDHELKPLKVQLKMYTEIPLKLWDPWMLVYYEDQCESL